MAGDRHPFDISWFMPALVKYGSSLRVEYLSSDGEPVRRGAKPRGSQRFERDDAIKEPPCGLDQGQQPCSAARTGRTHGCTRPVLIAAQKLLRRGGRPHMIPNFPKLGLEPSGCLAHGRG